MTDLDLVKVSDQDLYLRFKCESRLAVINKGSDTYRERLSYELSVIAQMGFASYFLIVADYIGWAKSRGILCGPGRGSAAGSLVAYLMQITEVDPIKWGLLFERFLNIGRISMPDIDSDFEMRRRSEVVQYLVQKYGADNVVQIGTVGTMKSRLAIRDTARALGVLPEDIDRYGKLVPEEKRGGQGDNAIKIIDCLNPTEDFKEAHGEPLKVFLNAYDKDRVFQDVVNRALEIERLPKSSGVHPAGLIIWDKSVDSIVPLTTNDDGSFVTQWSDKEVEGTGLVKYDLLGLRTLTVLEEAFKSIEKRTGLKLSWDDIDEEDPRTFEMLSEGDTFGVFQLTEAGMQRFTKDFKPKNIYDIAAISALYRPGPLDLGSCDEIVKIRNGEKSPEFPIAEIRDILEPTSGLMVFQEQILEIAKRLAGYSLSEADLLRRAVGKKIPAEMAAQEQRFVSGSVKNGISEQVAKKLFDDIAGFANYSFNASHAIAYSILSFQTGYLKAHYPADFYAANMSSQDNMEKIVPFIIDARRHKLRIWNPDVNESLVGFTPIDNFTIRFGLGAIRDCGESAVDHILSVRKDVPFKDLLDFCKRVNPSIVRKNNIVGLIKSGAFDKIQEDMNRYEMVGYLEEILKALKPDRDSERKNQLNMFESLFGESAGLVIKKPKIEVQSSAILADEKEYLGVYLSDSPLSKFDDLRKSVDLDDICDIDLPDLRVRILAMVSEVVIRQTKNGEFAILTLEDDTGILPAKMWNRVYEKYKDLLQVGNCLIFSGKTNVYRELELNVDAVFSAEEQYNSFVKVKKLDKTGFRDVLAMAKRQRGNVYYDLEIGRFRFRLGQFA